MTPRVPAATPRGQHPPCTGCTWFHAHIHLCACLFLACVHRFLLGTWNSLLPVDILPVECETPKWVVAWR